MYSYHLTKNNVPKILENTFEGYIYRIRFGLSSLKTEIDLAKELEVFE